MYKIQVRTISMNSLKRIVDSKKKKFHLVDVRSKEEYETGHIKGAVSILPEELEMKARHVFKPDDIIVTYDDRYAGSPSAITAKMLVLMGYRHVMEYIGGFSEWKASGFPTESGPP
jgi:rhodanese-related sulfurtransferase